jgi:hypothetical protein
MTPRETCPRCGSMRFKRNGHIHTGKPNHRYKACGRAYVRTPENSVIPEKQRMLLERLLLERISLRGLCRASGLGFGGFYSVWPSGSKWRLCSPGSNHQATPRQ